MNGGKVQKMVLGMLQEKPSALPSLTLGLYSLEHIRALVGLVPDRSRSHYEGVRRAATQLVERGLIRRTPVWVSISDWPEVEVSVYYVEGATTEEIAWAAAEDASKRQYQGTVNTSGNRCAPDATKHLPWEATLFSRETGEVVTLVTVPEGEPTRPPPPRGSEEVGLLIDQVRRSVPRKEM